MSALTAPNDPSQKPGEEIRIQAAAVKNYRGGAAAQVVGVGYATPLVPGTAGMQFIGVYLETNDNSGGVAGTIAYSIAGGTKNSFVRIAREGIWAFDQTGITQANIGQRAYFSDDHTVTTTPGPIFAGIIVTVDEEATALAYVDISTAIFTPARLGPQVLSASGAVDPTTPGTYFVTKAGVAALTLAAPTATVHDGTVITISSNTAYAHTLTATGLFQCGTASVNLATFAAYAGAGLTLIACQGKWNVLASVGITFS